ncbi:hypothetical protein PVK06_047851 [Gossypium arboreum]|uniref:Uncharacterized protein n=1 Tax=Gossypium arboreum TaxID=29729 RepID=A0ABR0MEI0_GOSAR|nr:hypothetical protein PVK06_047851 [Gossypium arboreum]
MLDYCENTSTHPNLKESHAIKTTKMAIKAQSPTKTLTREDRLIVDQSPLPSMLLSEPPQPSKYLRAMRNPPVLSHGLPCCILYLHDLHEMIHLSSSICYICTIKRFIFLCTINI